MVCLFLSSRAVFLDADVLVFLGKTLSVKEEKGQL